MRRLVKRLAICLILTGLMAGMAGCEEEPTPTYNLNLTVDPADGGTAVDVTGSAPYAAGTPVSLRTEAAPGHRFVNWSASAGSFADADATETTFTMPAQDVAITASFSTGQPILTWHDLDAIRDDLGGIYLLMNDLDSGTSGYAEIAGVAANGGKGWQPLGSADDMFTGVFDGQGYQIRDLTVNRPDEDGVGLFGVADEDAMVRNVAIVNGVVVGNDYVGSLVGDSWGSNVSNCYSTGSVTGENFVGGLIGINGGTVTESYSATGVEGDWWVGGLAGCNEGAISDSYATGSISGYQGIGGLVGDNYYGTVNACYSIGGVSGDLWVGGLIGANLGTATDSFWDTETSGTEQSYGGTGISTALMKDITTFTDTEVDGLDEPWDMTAVADAGQPNGDYVWNIVNSVSYPFLSWHPVS
jgi:hypothetical protein